MSDYQQPKRRGTRGPAPKGNRKAHTMAIEIDILEALVARAKAEGLTPSDVAARACALHLGMPVPPYCYPKKTATQETLPLAEAS